MLKRALFLAAIGLLLSAVTVQAADEKKKRAKEDKDLDPALAGQIRLMFDRMDGDKDTFLDKAELSRAFQNVQVQKAFLDSYDDDDDGKISFAEFEDAGRDFAENAEKTAEQLRKAQEQALKQAGANRRTILRRTPAARRAFHQLMKQSNQRPPTKK